MSVSASTGAAEAPALPGIDVAAPTIEHHREPFGIGDAAPRISWTVTAAPDGWAPGCAEIRFRSLGAEQLWRNRGADSVLIAWPFAELESRQRGEVSVRVGDDTGWSDWSPGTELEAGLLHADDWASTAIGPGWDDAASPERPSLLRGEFSTRDTVVAARLYATAHGVFQLELNGNRVGDDELAPGWTSYDHRLRYVTYDVTQLIEPGANVLGAWLADGWYRGRLGFHGGHVNVYGTETALLAQLEVEYADGGVERFGTGPGWLSAASPITRSGLLEGESYDARAQEAAWSTPSFPGSGWAPAAPRTIDPSRLVAPDGPPVRCTQEILPQAWHTTADGRLIVDFGQNLVGRLRIGAAAAAGTTVTLRHAEVLDPSGNLDTRPLRGATATDSFTFAGAGTEEWEPRFTIHGFRYAEITGWPSPDPDGIVARVLHTDMKRSGTFACDDHRLNRLHENVVWSMRGNFVDLPTDCPQRDERLGWTGDIQVFAPTGTYLYECSGLLVSWLKDVAAEQLDDGTVPWFVPSIPGGEQWTPPRPGAGWGDAAVLVPWSVYQATGDVEVLRRQYPSARAWSDLEHRLAGDDHVWDTGYQLGDWLDPSAPPDDPAHGETDPSLVATAYYYRSADVLSEIAGVLGLSDSALLRARADAARRAFLGRFRTGPGRLSSESQAAYAMAIVFGLFDESELPAAGSRLAELVLAADTHLTTGFLGTPLLLDALSSTGHFSLAMSLLRQDTVPSWLYAVDMGATSVWERWDSMLPSGVTNPGDMTSFNHYAFGAVADWMHRRLAGLAAGSAGWRHIVFEPGLDSGMDHAEATKQTPWGTASISWIRRPAGVLTELRVPVGSTAELRYGSRVERLQSGTHLRELANA